MLRRERRDRRAAWRSRCGERWRTNRLSRSSRSFEVTRVGKKRVAVLISGRGSNMVALIAAAQARDYPAEIVLVVSNTPNAAGLERARHSGIETAVIDHRSFAADREAFERTL